MDAIGPFLAESGVRALTEGEEVELYGGLLKSEGGPDFQLFLLELADL